MTAGAAAGVRPARRLWTWLLLAVLAGTLALHVGVSIAAFASTFDTATPGVMALHILKGARPLFYYGQSYMGALEAYLAALLFALFGASELTLSLSPILFSVGWVGATYLLFRDLLDERAGVAAALVAAVPGWMTLWYRIGSYGGYPATFFFGTLALWLCLRLATRPLSPRAEWAHILPLGLVVGLGLWTNYQSASYILTGGLLVLGYLVRVRFAPRVLGKFAVGAGCLLLGAWPLLLASIEQDAGGRLAQWNFSRGYIERTFKLMVHGELRYLMFPDVRMALALKVFVLVCLGVGLGLYLARLWRAADARDRRRVLLPLLYVAVFLGVFLPHSMASVRAPRYAIPLWTMIQCGLFAVPVTAGRAGLRRAAWLLLGAWTVYNLAGDVVMARAAAPKKQGKVDERQRAVATAERIGATNVVMVGGHVFGIEGQILTFCAADRVRFSSVYAERYQPAAQAAELDPNVALACEGSRLEKTGRALKDLGASFQAEKNWLGFLYDIKIPPAARRAIPAEEMSVALHGVCTGAPAAMLDRVRETSVRGAAGDAGGFTLDLGRERDLDSLWLLVAEAYGGGLPEKFDLGVSSDGLDFTKLEREKGDRTAVAYACGSQAYLKGYHGWFEIRFPAGTAGRYLRMAIKSSVDLETEWEAAEVYAFERAGEATAIGGEELDAIAAVLKERGVSFTVCDRWLSARLMERLPWGEGRYPVYPRFNPRHPGTRLSRRVVPGKGGALAVERGLADECGRLLTEYCGGSRPWQMTTLPHYAMFVFEEPPQRTAPAMDLVWTGGSLLKSAAAEPAVAP